VFLIPTQPFITVYRPTFLIPLGVLCFVISGCSFFSALIVTPVLILPCLAAFAAGIVCVIFGMLTYQIPNGYRQIKGAQTLGGWQFGYLNNNDLFGSIISISTQVYHTGEIEIVTPDDGILGVSATVVYTPDATNVAVYAHHSNVDGVLLSRVQRELYNWVNQPTIGTLKKALAH
jgi:hypothetical protein